MKQLFHGSAHIVECPILGQGKRTNDYGLGFYCTEDMNLAREWSVTDGVDGYVNQYSFDDDDMNIVRLDSDEYTCLHWIELLISNRIFDLNHPVSKMAAEYLHKNFHVDITNADVVIGYRADDSYFTYARDFLNNTICVEQLAYALRLGNLGKQYMIKSEKAFQALAFQNAEAVNSALWYPKKMRRDHKARRDYFNMDVKQYLSGLYINQIINEEVKANDSRLQ